MLVILKYKQLINNLTVQLVGGELGAGTMGNKKVERKWYGRVFGWERKMEEKMIDSGCFLLKSTKITSPQIGGKMGKERH